MLLVEDNEGDVLLVRKAFEFLHAPIRLHVANDGVSGVEFVRRGTPRPDLVILDMNLPLKSGGEVLLDLKNDPTLREIPVVVFSTSGEMSDVQAAYRGFANSYIRKPADIDEFFASIAALEKYWTEAVLLPAN